MALFLIGNAWAQSCTVEGIVKDPNGRALAGATLYIKGKDGSSFLKSIKTDANGHYIFSGLGNGPYSITLVVNDVVKASISNVSMRNGERETLNFGLQKGAAGRPLSTGKHYVWYPNVTGSHLGMWLEVNDDAKPMPIGMQERMRDQGNFMVQQYRDEHPSVGH